MFSAIWHNFFFDPIYNGLVFFIDVIPLGDVGLAIIAITILVKVILFPLSVKAVKTQKIIQELEPKMKAVKEEFKDDKEKQARAIMDLYKDAGLNPFAGVLLVLIQIPILIALYLSVYTGGGVKLPLINTEILYSFIPVPEAVSMMFLGWFDMAGRSLPLAILAGLAQMGHSHLSITVTPKPENGEKDFKAEFARSMQMQMKYVLPLIIFMAAYTISAAIALYFLVSSLVSIVQELLIRKHK